MSRTREVSKNPSTYDLPHAPRTQMATSPRDRSEYEMLMKTPPHAEPAESQDSQLALREVIVDAIDSLDPRSRLVFDAIAVERTSFRELGVRMNLGKSQCHRIYHKTCNRLADSLREEPLLKGRWN